MEEKVEVITSKKVVTDPRVKTEPPQQVFETKKTIFRLYQVIWYILGVVEVLLTFRVIFRLFGADPTIGFSNFIYTLSGPFSNPFFGVVAPTTVEDTAAYIEWSTLIAMIFYFVVASGLVKLFQMVKPVTPEEVEQAVDEDK